MHPVLSSLVGETSIGVVDFRDKDAFFTRHVRRSLHIPGVVGLNSRFSWLPPPKSALDEGRKLVIICRKDEKEELRKALSRWNVVQVIYDDDESFWNEASGQDLIVAGDQDLPSLLFEPSPLIEMAVLACEQHKEAGCYATLLDLGCGAARDIAYVVRRESKLRWLATGLDNLYATVERAKLLRQDMRLDSSHGSRIEDVIWAQATSGGTLQALQSTPGSKSKGTLITPSHGDEGSLPAFAQAHLSHATFDLILLIRFLPRPLLANLPHLTHNGSIIAISHFTTIKEEQDYPSPDASKRFEEWDVLILLKQWGPQWQVLESVIHRAEDGRPIRSVLFHRH